MANDISELLPIRQAKQEEIERQESLARFAEIQAAQTLWNKIKPRGDQFMWGIIFTLSIWGLLAIYSSTGALAYKKNGGMVEIYLVQQAGLLCVGFFIMFFVHSIPFRFVFRFVSHSFMEHVPGCLCVGCGVWGVVCCFCASVLLCASVCFRRWPLQHGGRKLVTMVARSL